MWPAAAGRWHWTSAVEAGVLDPTPVIAGVVDGLRGGVEVADLAAGFHDAVIRATATAVTRARGGPISAPLG